MELDDLQRDALGELFNIGVGRAANALSQIVSSEVMLSVPNVDLVTVSTVKEMLVKNEFRHFSTVSQYFEGPFNAELHRGQRSLVKNDLDALHGLRGNGWVGQIAAEQIDLLRDLG